ncbi:MAG: UDP-N-acetylmuramoyl-L-alanine--D-glutamate ligase [Armatimonadota bacterium]
MLDVAGKRIHIIGLGAKGTGGACARVLGARGALITISDGKTPAELAEEVRKLDGLNVRLQLGPEEAYRDIETADLVVPSPGVPLAIPPIQRALAAGVPVLSEIELAYQLARAPIVAITGTKGKTTTTTLIGLLLEALGQPARVGGNIGLPLIELAAEAGPEEILVAEVSSFQLEAIEEFHPRVAVFTNLYPDHLDRYEYSMELYLAAKLNLFTNQTAEDFTVVNADRPESARVEAITRAKIIRTSVHEKMPGGVYVENGQIVSEVQGAPVAIMPCDAVRLRGEHNLSNALEAIAAVAALGLPVERVAAETLGAFRGVPNRLEEVETVNGVTFFNDSQGTTPMAVRMALQAFAATPPVLIAGGQPKITDFSELGADIAQYARALIVIGEAADLIAGATRQADPAFPIHHAASLPEAVRLGYELAQPKGVVLLSPACASFDMFRNMEHRGEVFRQAVAELKETEPQRHSGTERA